MGLTPLGLRLDSTAEAAASSTKHLVQTSVPFGAGATFARQELGSEHESVSWRRIQECCADTTNPAEDAGVARLFPGA